METATGLAAHLRVDDRTRLVAASFLMLFVELALIRWTGANVVYLSYFSNFVLLGAFLGIGLGFLRADRGRRLLSWTPLLLAGVVVFVRLFPVEIDRSGDELIYFGRLDPAGLPLWIMLPIIFLASAGIMATIAAGVADAFKRFEPLEAYRLDILGSIAGIVFFSVLSFLRAPSIGWGLIAAAVLFVLLNGDVRPWKLIPLLVLVGMLATELFTPGMSWSPYYEVTTERRGPDHVGIYANGIPHQAVTSVARRRESEPIYFIPYERKTRAPREVLIVGAGNGTDVAIALDQGAEHVDAVEIDPRLYEIGREEHPDAPYDDGRVSIHIDDGRAFLENSDRKYDLVLFALPDSLTLVSGQSSLRLESYLFTEEAMATARDHLAPDGVFAMYNFYRETWLVDRLAGMLEQAYGQAPCVDAVGDRGKLAVLLASMTPGALDCPQDHTVPADVPRPATDDYPFLYLREPGIPLLYLLTLGLILAASLAAVGLVAGPPRRLSPYTDLFFMGVAFLLLETMHIVRFALLFGTTWFVNALVFAGILLSVLAAIEVAQRMRSRRPAPLYGLLFVALLAAWLMPQHWMLDLPVIARFVVATVLAFLPIFLANLVFAQRFKGVARSTAAFGANLLGAMLGGVLEYGALVVGHRSLLLAVAVLYGLAFLTGRKHLQPAST